MTDMGGYMIIKVDITIPKAGMPVAIEIRKVDIKLTYKLTYILRKFIARQQIMLKMRGEDQSIACTLHYASM